MLREQACRLVEVRLERVRQELRWLLDHLATEAILADEVRRHGGLPPRLAALLGCPVASS